MATEKNADLFRETVRLYFQSQGCRVVVLEEDILEVCRQGIDPNQQETRHLVGLINDRSKDLRPDLHVRLVNDSRPVPGGALRAGETAFGRDILVRGWERLVSKQTEELDRQDAEARPVTRQIKVIGQKLTDDKPSDGTAPRTLICGNPEDGVEWIVRERRRDLLESIFVREGRFVLPVPLSGLRVREQGVLVSLKDALSNYVERPLADEVYQAALRCGFFRIFVEWISDWNVNGDIDPNQGTMAEFFRVAGREGEFVLGCDKEDVFHYVRQDILQRKADKSYLLRTVGERFSQDQSLCLEVVSPTEAPESAPLAETNDWRRTAGLLGAGDWRRLLRQLAEVAYRLERPGFVPDAEVYKAISDLFPPERRLTINVDVVMRAIQSSGLFEYEVGRGLRFRSRALEETLAAEQLGLYLEDLVEYGTDMEGRRYLTRVVDLLIAPQVTERMIYLALKNYGKGQVNECVPLVGNSLLTILEPEYKTIPDQFTLRRLRLAVLRVIVVLTAWLEKEGQKPLESLRDMHVDFSGVEARQLYVYNLDLGDAPRQLGRKSSGAGFSNAQLPFACFERCRLVGINASNAYLPSARFVACDLRSANFRLADLSACVVVEGELADARFEGASLWAGDLSGASKIASKDIFREANTKLTRLPLLRGKGKGQSDEQQDLAMIDAWLRSRDLEAHGGTRRQYCRHPGVRVELDPVTHALTVEQLSAHKEGPAWSFEIHNVQCFHCCSLGHDLGLLFVQSGGRVSTWRVACGQDTPGRHVMQREELTCGERPVIKIFPDGKAIGLQLKNSNFAIAIGRDLFGMGGPKKGLHLETFSATSAHAPTCALAVCEEEERYLVVGLANGDLTVFDSGHPSKPTFVPGTVPPTDMAFLPDHQQLIVARQDSAVDVYYCRDWKSIQRLTTFQLAHKSIHSILEYPGQSRYLVAGVAGGDDRAKTLFALCHVRLEVMAAWVPEMPKNVQSVLKDACKREPEKEAGSDLTRFSEFTQLEKDDVRTLEEWLSQSTISVEGGARPKYASTPGLEPAVDGAPHDAASGLEPAVDGSLSDSTSDTAEDGVPRPSTSDGAAQVEGELKVRICNPKPFKGKFLLRNLLTVTIGGHLYFLRFRLELRRYSDEGRQRIDLRREVPQESVRVEIAASGSDLVLSFRHPVLQKQSALKLLHEIILQMNYETGPDATDCVETPARQCTFYPERRNPFHFTTAVSGDQFIGNKAHVTRIVQSTVAGVSCIVQGSRRSGKSSVLKESERLLEKGHRNAVVVRFTLQPCHLDVALLVEEIVKRVPESLNRRNRRDFNAAAVLARGTAATDQSTNRLEVWLKGTIEELQRVGMEDPFVVVMLDEFGHLYGQADTIPAVAPPEVVRFANGLRSLIEVSKQFRFVLAGLPFHFERLGSALTESVLGSHFADWHFLGRVPSSDIENIIRGKLEGVAVKIQEQAMRRCLDLASGVMHDANVIMYHAFGRMVDSGAKADEILRDHLDNSEPNLARRYSDYLKALWKCLDPATMKWLIEESAKSSPIWEREAIKAGSAHAPDVEAVLAMGYGVPDDDASQEAKLSTQHLKLFIPRGLALSIAQSPEAAL